MLFISKKFNKNEKYEKLIFNML